MNAGYVEVKSSSNPTNAVYSRDYGEFTTPSGVVVSWEMGDYPAPVEDPETGEQYDEIVFGVKASICIDGRGGYWLTLDDDQARSLLHRAGVSIPGQWSGFHGTD